MEPGSMERVKLETSRNAEPSGADDTGGQLLSASLRRERGSGCCCSSSNGGETSGWAS